MGIPPLAFTGVSSYSADFQKILDRTVAIASQPITQLQSEQAKVLQQRTLAGVLRTSADGLTSAVRALGELGASKALSGSSSNTAKVTVGAVTAATPAAYTISEITSLARAAAGASAGYASGTSAVSAGGNVRFSFNGTNHDITLTPTENTLTGLRDKINAIGAGVTATILTTGTGSTPYYLSITANTTGEKPIALVDDPGGAATNLLASADNGANANFKVNGVAVSKSSNLVNDVVSGVAFSITGTTSGSETVTLTLASSRSNLSAKLQAFVNAYNNLLETTDAQIGEAAGLLTGDLLIREAKGLLRKISGHTGTGAIKDLAALGIRFANDGKASLEQPAFDALSDADIQNVFTFLGSISTGFGGLQASLNQLSDPITGLIAVQSAKYDETDRRITARVDDLAARLSQMQISAAERLRAVDAILGSLESQKAIVDASYKSLQLALFGKNDG
jgi:flagellar hook-associated protein 2